MNRHTKLQQEMVDTIPRWKKQLEDVRATNSTAYINESIGATSSRQFLRLAIFQLGASHYYTNQ